jgi:hypothetical protein
MVIRGRTGTWSVGPSSIVGVFPVRDRIQLVAVGDLILDPAEQLVLAEKAAIRPVRQILGAVTFVGRDLEKRYADLARDIMGGTTVLGREAW